VILWRHILKAMIGPFLFSNAVIIFLFLLQFLMKSAADLVGKGLSIWVIIELIALNLAWMLVLAVPMSVLVASLMAFGKLSADNETTIMRASGMSLYRMMAPVILFALLVTAGLISFNNDVLPDANIRLRTLMSDIIRKKPTLSLQAGVFTSEEQVPNFRILVRKTFEKTNDLEGVTIYDLSKPDKNIVVSAEYGTVSFSKGFTKIFMDLRDGEIHELDAAEPGKYRRLRFQRHRVAIPASGFGFERSDANKARRDDRTMSAPDMMHIVDSIGVMRMRKDSMLSQRVYKNAAEYFQGMVLSVPVEGTPDNPYGGYLKQEFVSFREIENQDSLFALFDSSFVPTSKDSLQAAFRASGSIKQIQSYVQSDLGALEYDQNEINKYLVEVYKKYSIPVASLVFALIGVPLGMMARRGGFGVGAGLSLGFFLFYWACLIGGEKFADRNVLTPFWGMWIANILLGSVGILLSIRTARESTVIDWSKFSRFVPKAFRSNDDDAAKNPHEA
jgi:lipopolysaccharide export system permease protein